MVIIAAGAGGGVVVIAVVVGVVLWRRGKGASEDKHARLDAMEMTTSTQSVGMQHNPLAPVGGHHGSADGADSPNPAFDPEASDAMLDA